MAEPAEIVRPNLLTACAEWPGACNSAGYGHFYRGGHHVYVHRAVWEALYGPIPKGLCVLHRCDNPPCYNVEHLFLGTKGDNLRDAIGKGRWRGWQAGKTHCKHGHEFTPVNTLVLAGGRRVCRACNRRRTAERRARRARV